MTDQQSEEDAIANKEERENAAIEEATPISAPAVFEAIRRSGVEELQRPTSALVLSALVAGLALGFSVLGKALMHRFLPDAPWRPLVESLGYSFGFLLVIMGQMQLFTENTITAVCPYLSEPKPKVLRRLVRLWVLVFVFNVVGAILLGLALTQFRHVEPETFEAIRATANEALGFTAHQVFWLGIGAGWLIAALVWIMPNSGSAKVPLIIIATWFLSLAGFSHVIAGSCEAAFLLAVGDIGFGRAILGFTLPALAGNVVGGTVFFTILMWGQIKVERARPEPDFSYETFWKQ
ncbi:formate/nitrite transporter family protein [Martelella endophytica]|uniref:formate/nitrite transporter family protein n=1 Tax=Martelella endophytica TaxID=1486262 RepID=UPI0005F2215D|nr:formate/nitrite transporter family protein [Martelella endophytica]